MATVIVDLVNLFASAVSWLVILNALLSWLVAFQVFNPRNPVVYSVLRFLDAAVSPILAPFRRVIPPLGGMDLSPVIFLVLLNVVFLRLFNEYAAPALFAALP